MVIEAAEAGKAVFVEKPMALNEADLKKLERVLEKTKVPFMVGFNRRFSLYARKIKEIIVNRINPMIINYRMNAGYIPLNHWVHIEEGGGRNIGEACHIYDLFNFFTESAIESTSASSISPETEQYSKNDNFIATIKYKDGSVCNLIYTGLGTKDVPKERMDIYVDGKIIQMDDYRNLRVFGVKGKVIKNKIQDKGHYDELRVFAESIKDGDGYPIPLWQLIQATEISFEVEKKISKRF
jgi:predicted dehydrogenase